MSSVTHSNTLCYDCIRNSEGEIMSNTFDIRLSAINDNFKRDGDNLRRSRELAKLEVDACNSLRRCQRAGDEDCSHLEELCDHLDDVQRGTLWL